MPIDLLVSGDSRGLPDLETFRESVEHYARQRSAAVASGSFADRAWACWGLVARGEESLAWCRPLLTGTNEIDIEDAVGVAGWVGVPAAWQGWIEDLVGGATSEARDALVLLLPPTTAARIAGDAATESGVRSQGVPLDGAFEPFTSIIYFVHADYEKVVAQERSWRLGLRGSSETRWTEHRGHLAELVELLEPFAMPSWKSLLVETASDWTAVFSQGSDLNYVAHFADLLDTTVVRTHWSPHVVRDGRVVRYGDTSVWMWEGSGGQRKQTRTLQATRQSSRWEWHDEGTPLPFEDVARYTERKVRDRFDVDALNDFCGHLGIHRAEGAFYGPRATLESLDPSGWANARTMTGAQWRADHA